MSHAAATSQVGQVANYAAAVAALNAATTQEAQTTAIAAAATALAEAANKSISLATVTALNVELGLTVTPEDAASIAEQAAAAQAAR